MRLCIRTVIITSIVLLTISTFSISFNNYLNINNQSNLESQNLKISEISGKITINGEIGWVNAKTSGICIGSGTESNPYIIEDLEIDAGYVESCIYIQYSSVYFKIINCTLINSGGPGELAGIRLVGVENGKLINNTINNCFQGIHAEVCSNMLISGNDVRNSDETGIFTWDFHYSNITGNNVRNNHGSGIFMAYGDNNVISVNILDTNWADGISLEDSHNNLILGNTAINQFQWGISIDRSNYNTLSGNNADYNNWGGIYVLNGQNNLVSENFATGNELGINIESSDNNRIISNTINNNNVGISLDGGCTCNIVSNNNFSGNNENIQNLQGFCFYDIIIPLAIGIIIGISSTITVILLLRRRKSKRKIIFEEKPIDISIKEKEEAIALEKISVAEELMEEEVAIKEEIPIKEVVEIKQNPVSKATLTIIGSWIFAYLLTTIFSQIGLVLIHVIMGRTENIIYLNPFEIYTNIPNPLADPYLWLIGSNFLNMICAILVFFITWVKKSQYLLPLLMWAPAVFIVEGIMIISQFPGLFYGYWTEAFQAGLHIGIGVLLSIIFLIVGLFMMYLAKLLIYDVTRISRGKILLINIIGFPFWFIMNAFYYNFAPFIMVSLFPSIIIPLFNTIVEKPLLPFLGRKFHVHTKPLKWYHVGSSLGFAMVIILILIFAPFEPYSDRAHLVNIIIITFFLIIGIPFASALIYKKGKSSEKVSFLIKKPKKVIPSMEKEGPIALEGISVEEEIVEEEIIEEIVALEEILAEEEVPKEIPTEEEVIEEEVAVPEEVAVEEEVVEEEGMEELVALEGIPVEEKVVEGEIVAPEKASFEEAIVEELVDVPEEITVEEEVVEEEVITPEEIYIEEEVAEEDLIPKEPLELGPIVHYQTLKGHAMGISSIAISPDNKYIISGSKDTTIKIWERDTGKLLRSLRGHKKYINSVVVSPDGKYIISGSNDKTVKVWDLNTGKLVKTLEGHTFYILAVAVSPDNNYIVSSSFDREIKVWDLASGKLLNTFKGHRKEIGSIAISPDNKYIASGSNDKTIKVWDLKTGELAITISGYKKYVTSVAFSPNGKYIISGSNDKSIRVWDISIGKLVRTFVGHTFYVSSVAISPDGNFVVSGSFDNDVKVWEFSTGNLLMTLEGHQKEISSVAISPDNKYILSASNDKLIKIWAIQ
ncbi:MAG: NosD domain-containing protein [Promethearchaeota archaeon]